MAAGYCAWGILMGTVSYGTMTSMLQMIGYLQSIERGRSAALFSALRGVVLIIPAFIFMPQLIEGVGIWLALPVAESVTMILIYSYIEYRSN